jgi:anti-sigma-K factor RskA
MNGDVNIDELLNGYIDGELTDRNRTEIQRLISHDDQVANRLRQLQKCKTLVTALPPAEVSGRLLERIKTSLETKTLVGSNEQIEVESRRGAVHLFARRLMTAAALFILLAVLGAVVFTIITPGTPPAAPVAFKGTLELGTSNVAAIANVINNSAIAVTPALQDGKRTYVITGSREAVTAMLTDMSKVWESIDSSKLTVETKTGNPTGYYNLRVPEITALINPPKPRLTEHESGTEGSAGSAKPQKIVELTIVVSDGK